MLFSEPKIPQCRRCARRRTRQKVSVLFSEPKIPQSNLREIIEQSNTSFSALQRAENSSIFTAVLADAGDAPFQCSSASRKFLNRSVSRWQSARSAVSVLFSEPKIPQYAAALIEHQALESFSALQRAENSSIQRRVGRAGAGAYVSVLFSEPKIPQWGVRHLRPERDIVSVLFSEPKIPQLRRTLPARCTARRFSALQRAENSSIEAVRSRVEGLTRFSALQRAENSSIFCRTREY